MTNSGKEISLKNDLVKFETGYWKQLFFNIYFGNSARKIFSSRIILELFRNFSSTFFFNLACVACVTFFSFYESTLFAILIENKSENFANKKKTIAKLLVVYGIVYLSSYFHNFVESKLQNDSFYFIKQAVIRKLLGLEFEDKISKKADISMINEEESWIVAENWIHIPAHFFSSIVSFASLFYVGETRSSIIGAGLKGNIVSVLFILSLGSVNFYFTSKQDKKREQLRIPIRNEAYLTEKEISKSTLIDSMGLKNEYFARRERVVEDLNKSYSNLANSEISLYSLIAFSGKSFPFLLAIFGSSSLSVYFVIAFSRTLESFLSLAECYKESKSLAFSLNIIDSFLLLPEKTENSTFGLKLSEEQITSITFYGVSFSYRNFEKDVIYSYNNSFVKSNLNRIDGENGTGKSTILYLSLGLIEPKEGKVVVGAKSGKKFDINRDVDLVDWKEKVVAYISHENLFEQNEGSTGQKQVMNIEKVISEKKSAQIFLFDEADNSLDENNKIIFHRRLDQLVSDGKIVILVSH